jgi:hypothetical protein
MDINEKNLDRATVSTGMSPTLQYQRVATSMNYASNKWVIRDIFTGGFVVLFSILGLQYLSNPKTPGSVSYHLSNINPEAVWEKVSVTN